MIPFLPGLIVARALPETALAGLVTGAYTLHGGVIRHAAGTAQGGQIVAHLLPAGPPAATLPGVASGAAATAPTLLTAGLGAATLLASGVAAGIGLLGAGLGLANLVTTRRVLTTARETMHLAELNLAITRAGFAALDQRLARLEQALIQIPVAIQEIRDLLERQELAELRAALHDLAHIDQLTDPENRRLTLHRAKETLTRLRLQDGELLDQRSTRVEVVLAQEEYYCLTALARVCCFIELGEYPMARHELRQAVTFWTAHARRIANDVLLQDTPQRFLTSDFADDVPVAAIAAWMDFIHAEPNGLAWIDTLRKGSDPWYYLERTDLTTKYRKGTGDPLGKPVKSRRCASDSNRETLLRRDRELIIPYLCKLVARRQVLEGYQAQCELLETYQLTPAAFEQKLRDLDIQGDEFVILLSEEYSSV
jgi:hypothetical protein